MIFPFHTLCIEGYKVHQVLTWWGQQGHHPVSTPRSQWRRAEDSPCRATLPADQPALPPWRDPTCLYSHLQLSSWIRGEQTAGGKRQVQKQRETGRKTEGKGVQTDMHKRKKERTHMTLCCTTGNSKACAAVTTASIKLSLTGYSWNTGSPKNNTRPTYWQFTQKSPQGENSTRRTSLLNTMQLLTHSEDTSE